MVLDTSAVVAVLTEEPAAESLVEAMGSAESLSIGAPTLVECLVVMGHRVGFEKKTLLYRFLQAFQVAVIPFGESHWELAGEAYQRFGKGRHVAGLNLGDCLTYAIAKAAHEPLLCIGEDFRRTDLTVLP